MNQALPRALGIAGLVPFVALALAAVLGAGAWQEQAVPALVAYGAVILSYLGGISWGAALRDRGNLVYLLSMLPFFSAWAALLIPRVPALMLLTAAFLAALLNDRIAHRRGLLPDWFMFLRWWLTAVVVACLLFTALLS